ncbi:hypothetical protein CoNPh11_CDS0115 [Staphylococcus phage S-CoN_Ph11]|nr:hypothetical protein CoNPh11_CDS0115 [Staphylococcus phage S-CoN_Ph11]
MVNFITVWLLPIKDSITKLCLIFSPFSFTIIDT